MDVASLPTSLLVEVFLYVDISDAASFGRVSKTCRKTYRHPLLWNRLFLRDFSYPPIEGPRAITFPDNAHKVQLHDVDWSTMFFRKHQFQGWRKVLGSDGDMESKSSNDDGLVRSETLPRAHPFTFRTGVSGGASSILIDDKNGKLIYTAKMGVGVVSLESGRSLGSLPKTGHSKDITSVDIDSRFMVTSSADKTIRMFDWETMACVRVSAKRCGHGDAVTVVKILPSAQAVTASLDGLVKLWCLEEGKCLQTLDPSGRSFDGSFAATARELLAGPILGLNTHSESVYFTCGEHRASHMNDAESRGQLCQWDARTATGLVQCVENRTCFASIDRCSEYTWGCGAWDGSVSLFDVRNFSRGTLWTACAHLPYRPGRAWERPVTHLQLTPTHIYTCQPTAISAIPYCLTASPPNTQPYSNTSNQSALDPSGASTIFRQWEADGLMSQSLAATCSQGPPGNQQFRSVCFASNFQGQSHSAHSSYNSQFLQRGVLAVGFGDSVLVWGTDIVAKPKEKKKPVVKNKNKGQAKGRNKGGRGNR